MAVTIDGTNGITSPDFEPSGSTTPTNGLFLPTTNTLAWATNSTERLRLDASGNMGLGVTPSSTTNWLNLFVSKAVIQGRSADGSVVLGSNQTGAGAYYTSNYATYYYQNSGNGTHAWYIAPSGTAGAAITFTQAMTLDASGNLGIGETSPSQRLHIKGSSGTYIRAFSTTNSVDAYFGSQTNDATVYVASNHPLTFATNGTERARIDSSGRFLVGTTSTLDTANNFQVVDGISAYTPNSQSFTSANAGACVFKVGRMTTSRSINASGTINASGADYAEYMVKAGDFTINKGDICGIDVNGLLTNVFNEAVTFVVKSTDPSYVGNDSWGAGIEDQEELESEREKVDRIAFAGQVPVNVLGATPGDYIIPVEDAGSIKGEAVSDPTFEQYQKAVGKVIAIESDGRARIIVKVA